MVLGCPTRVRHKITYQRTDIMYQATDATYQQTDAMYRATDAMYLVTYRLRGRDMCWRRRGLSGATFVVIIVIDVLVFKWLLLVLLSISTYHPATPTHPGTG